MPSSRLTGQIVADMQRHQGLITRRRLVEHHRVPPRRVDWWIESGTLSAVHQAIYRRTAGYVPEQQALLAAIWDAGTGALAGQRQSLRLSGARDLDPGPVSVVIPRPRHLRPRAYGVQSILMDERDRAMVDGIPCLQTPMALIQLTSHLAEQELRRVIDQLRRCRAITLGELQARAEGMPGHPGARALLRTIASPAMAQENDGERSLARLLCDFDPQPRWQVDDLVRGRRLDACWVEALYVLELDGRDHHVLPTDRDADGFRDLQVHDSHLLVHRITTGMIRDHPARVLRGIRGTYERRLSEVHAMLRAGSLPTWLAARVRAGR